MENGPFAADRVTKLLERLAYQIRGTMQTRDSQAVHDLRVAIRRFVQALTVFKPCFAPRESRKIRRRLRDLMRLAGDVRDCDIALGLLSPARWPEQNALRQQIESRRKESARSLAGALRLWVARKRSSKWRVALEAGSTIKGFCRRTVDETAGRELARMAKDFFQSGTHAVEAKASAVELHRFRMDAKDLRYTIELFAEVYGAAAGEWIGQIKGVQTVLGRVNDCRTARSLVADAGGSRKIEASLKRRQRRKTQEFRREWAELFPPAVARQWVAALRRPAQTPGRKPAARSQAAGSSTGMALEA